MTKEKDDFYNKRATIGTRISKGKRMYRLAKSYYKDCDGNKMGQL